MYICIYVYYTTNLSKVSECWSFISLPSLPLFPAWSGSSFPVHRSCGTATASTGKDLLPAKLFNQVSSQKPSNPKPRDSGRQLVPEKETQDDTQMIPK